MIKTLHALRFVFIMLIVFSHIVGESFDFGGECGVSFFFMLSGFVLALGYGGRVEQGQFDTNAFLMRQLLKFYPLHLLALVTIVVLDAHSGHFLDWQHLMPAFLLLQSWIPLNEYNFAGNGPSWFLCDILFCYILFSKVYLGLNRLTRTCLAWLLAVVVVAYLMFAFAIPADSVNSILYVAPWMRLIDFCLGILLCRLYCSASGRQWAQRMAGRNVTASELLAVVLLAASLLVYPILPQWLHCVALFWLVIPPFLLFFALAEQGQGLVTRLLKHPSLQWLGGISLEIYLLHMLVLRIANSLLAGMGIEERWLMVIGGLGLLILAAWMTKRFFVDKIYASLIKYVI